MTEEMTECPICMEKVCNTNMCSTECGHVFHTSCLMKNAMTNGLHCPYCRTMVAEEVKNTQNDNDNESDISFEETTDEYALRGLRFMNYRVNGQEIPWQDDYDENESISANECPPNVNYILNNMSKFGITLDMLVADYLTSLDWHQKTSKKTEYETELLENLDDKMNKIFDQYIENGDYHHHSCMKRTTA